MENLGFPFSQITLLSPPEGVKNTENTNTKVPKAMSTLELVFKSE